MKICQKWPCGRQGKQKLDRVTSLSASVWCHYRHMHVVVTISTCTTSLTHLHNSAMLRDLMWVHGSYLSEWRRVQKSNPGITKCIVGTIHKLLGDDKRRWWHISPVQLRRVLGSLPGWVPGPTRPAPRAGPRETCASGPKASCFSKIYSALYVSVFLKLVE